METIFNHYDVNTDGGLDYYEFIGKVFKLPPKTPKQGESIHTGLRSKKDPDTKAVVKILEKIRDKLQKRGKTIIDIGR